MELYAAVWFIYESIIDIASEVLAACASGTTCDIVRGGGGGGGVQRCGTRGERTYSSQKAGLPLSRGPYLLFQCYNKGSTSLHTPRGKHFCDARNVLVHGRLPID